MASLPKPVADESTCRILRKFDLDRSAIPMWVFDVKSLAFLSVNDAAVRLYGYSRREFLAMTILDIRPNNDIVRVVRRMLRSPVRPAVGEVWTHEKKDHSLFDVEINSHEIPFNGHAAEIVTSEPVSGQRRHAADMRHDHHLEESRTASV